MHGAGRDNEPTGLLKLVARIKKTCICISVTFLVDSCMNVPNSCMIGKEKYYVILNVLKFEEYIIYVKVQI